MLRRRRVLLSAVSFVIVQVAVVHVGVAHLVTTSICVVLEVA